MTRKLIIDCDPGIDDALALCIAMFDERLDVIAVTAVEGNVPADVASRNVQTIIDHLDPPKLPRVGKATPPTSAPQIDWRKFQGADGLGNSGFPVSELHHQHPSEKIICDEVRAAPNEVSILALGPLSNIARAFQRDPTLPGILDRLIIMGGSVDGVGNITPVAEFNTFYDPESARLVYQSATTKSIVPLDVTRRVKMSLSLLNEFSEETNVGEFLHSLLQFSFREFHQRGQESIFLHDVVALIAMLQPELFETVEMEGDVETKGELTTGMTVFDRRSHVQQRANMEVAIDIDVEAVKDCIVRGLRNSDMR